MKQATGENENGTTRRKVMYLYESYPEGISIFRLWMGEGDGGENARRMLRMRLLGLLEQAQALPGSPEMEGYV